MDMLFNITNRKNKVTTTLYLKEIERISPIQSAAASHKKLKGSLDTRGIAEHAAARMITTLNQIIGQYMYRTGLL